MTPAVTCWDESFLNFWRIGNVVASSNAIAESIAKKNTVIKNMTEKSAENDENVASVSGIIANTREGQPLATSVTATQFWVARYPSVPNTAKADKSEIRVFQSATYTTDFAISDFGFLNAPYTIIAHIASERVKNICPAAAVHVLRLQSFAGSKLRI